MKITKVILFMLLSIFMTTKAYTQDNKVRIAFIGNSITIGAGVKIPDVESYPSRVREMLKEFYGDTCIVNNYAVSGRTMLKNGDFPIWNEGTFTQMWNSSPDIVFILMGTNDSKPYNWDVCGADQFTADYLAMIDTMKVRNPRTKFMIAFPPPAYKVVWDIRDSVILNGVIPIVDSISKIHNIPVVDFYTPLIDSVNLFPDFIHPGVEGSLVMAQMVIDKFIETDIVHQVELGFPAVTSIKSNKKVVAPGDSALITWTTTNTDSLFLDGEKVEVNSSKYVYPTEKTTYKFIAYNDKGVDSLSFTQNIYIPTVKKIRLSPTSQTINKNDSVTISASFTDQEIKPLIKSDVNLNWTIKSGGGYIINKTGTSATFVGSEAGRSIIIATVDSVTSSESKITVVATDGNSWNKLKTKLNVYPNPINDKLNFDISGVNAQKIEATIYDLKGSVCLKQQFEVLSSNTTKFEMNVEMLNPGIYLFEVTGNEKYFSGRITKEAK